MVSISADPVELGAGLERLAPRRRGRVPFVAQMEAADCGAACLAMVARYHGDALSLEEARQVTGAHRGSDARVLLRAAGHLGLRGRGVQLEVDDLRHLAAASILHWNFNHFVVFERVRGGVVDLVDPASGRRSVPLDRFRRHFTGVALELEPAASFVRRPARRRELARYLALFRGHAGRLGRVVVTSVALRVLALTLPILTAMIVDRVVPRGDVGLLAVIGGGVAAVLGFQLLASLIRAHLLIELRTILDTKMTIGFVSHLLSLPYAYFTRRSTGDLLLRVRSNSQIREMLTAGMMSTLLDGTLALAYLALLFTLAPPLATVALVAGGLQVAVLVAWRRRFAGLAAQDLDHQARSHAYLAQALVGVETVKALGAERRVLDHWGNLYVDELGASLARARLGAVIEAVNSFLQSGASLLLVAVGAYLVIGGALSLGAMLAAAALAGAFLAPLSSLITSGLQLQTLGSYLERIDDILEAEPEQRPGATVAPPRLSGAIAVQQLSFRYSPGEPWVLREVEVTIEAGSTVAIVGRSGSGKSTLAALLLGLHRPTEGRITYDGHDLVELDHAKLRQQLGVVPQQPFVLSSSIRQNIALADPALPIDRIVAAARRACVDEDIRAMPMGYETILADAGATLSGGQRQRLALARALVHEPAILLLDEATSALDAATERRVMDNLSALRATRVVIAHRLSTVVGADQILVMDRGRVVEAGTHAELLARRGAYAALIAEQAFLGDARPAARAEPAPEVRP